MKKKKKTVEIDLQNEGSSKRFCTKKSKYKKKTNKYKIKNEKYILK